ncbi:MAG TPA: hypothetical protein VLD60_08205 [Nitrospira sp.]|nr:hypothetical protein [Nitrospira sp.]
MRSLRSAFLILAIATIPAIGLAELPDFGPPDAGVPFDDIDDATLQAEVTKQALAFLDNLHSHWGETPDRLRTTVAGEIERDEQGTLIYLRNISDHGVLEGYEFKRESLVRGQYIVLQRPLNGLNEFIGYYEALKRTLIETYGIPLHDRIVWDNDLYQPVPDYWGVAVMIGHLHYHAAWETAEGTLTLELTGNRHSKLFLEYKSRVEGAQT